MCARRLAEQQPDRGPISTVSGSLAFGSAVSGTLASASCSVSALEVCIHTQALQVGPLDRQRTLHQEVVLHPHGGSAALMLDLMHAMCPCRRR